MALQTSAAVKSDAKASTLALSRHSPCKSASKPAKLQQQVQLPSIFTIQVISSVICCCFHSAISCFLILQSNSLQQGNSMLPTNTGNVTATSYVQGVSANTSCFNSLSYKTSDNRCVHGLVQSFNHVDAASLYLEDSVTLPKSKRLVTKA